MQALMKVQTTNDLNKTISVTVPAEYADKAYEAIRGMFSLGGFELKEEKEEPCKEYYTIEEVFPDASPAMAFRGLRSMEGLSQKEMAKKLGITQNRISQMESGKQGISKAMAKKIEEVFGVNYKVFL